MGTKVICPACGVSELDLRAYESMMVLSVDQALFSLRCPHCGKRISTVEPIPACLREEVEFAAIEVDAGMGHKA